MKKRIVTALFLLVFSRTVDASSLAHVSNADLNRARSVLREGLQSDEFWPAMHAAEAMTIAGMQDEVISHLQPLLAEETDDQRRCGLSRELVRAGQRKYAAVMFGILQSDDPHGHVHAAESLFKVGWDGDYEPMREAFVKSDNVILRLMAAGALAKHGSVPDRMKALKFLRSVLSDSDEANEYRIASWVLARTGDSSDIPRMRSRLPGTADERVRVFLFNSMAALGDENGQGKLRQTLSSEDPAFRTYAATFAGDAGMVDVIPDLVALLNDENLDARIRAAQSIFSLRKKSLQD